MILCCMEESETIFEDFLVQITCEEIYENEDLYGVCRVNDEDYSEE